MAEIDIWFIFIDHDKPVFRRSFERLHPHNTTTHLIKKIKEGDHGELIINVKMVDIEVWKFKSLKIDPRDKQQMGGLLGNLKFTDTDSDVELVDELTLMEELHLQEFEPLLVRVVQGTCLYSSASCSLLSPLE